MIEYYLDGNVFNKICGDSEVRDIILKLKENNLAEFCSINSVRKEVESVGGGELLNCFDEIVTIKPSALILDLPERGRLDISKPAYGDGGAFKAIKGKTESNNALIDTLIAEASFNGIFVSEDGDARKRAKRGSICILKYEEFKILLLIACSILRVFSTREYIP